MATIHDLIIKHGRDGARQMLPADERHLIDSAAAMLEEHDPALGITYTGFCLTALPHRKLDDGAIWEQRGHNVSLVVAPGQIPDKNGEPITLGVPYGSRARLILLYLQTQAVRSSSPEVELGSNMAAWLRRMGVATGGKQYRDVRDQADRISACNLTFIWRNNGAIQHCKDSIVKGGIRFCDDDGQPRLWEDTVRLSDNFYQALKDHPVPIAEPALRHIANTSMAIDIYVWLAYRLHSISPRQPAQVSWAALHHQFGAGYAQIWHFKPRFLGPLKEALAVYPDAKVDITDTGLTLHHSRPPILEKQLRLV